MKANGRKPREAVPKGQSLLSFTKKTLKDKVQESAQQVKISDFMQLESKESDERDHIQPGHSLKRKRNDDDDKLDSKRSKSWIEAQLDNVLNFFSKFIPQLNSDTKKLATQTTKLENLAERTEKLLASYEKRAQSEAQDNLQSRISFDKFVSEHAAEGLRVHTCEQTPYGTCSKCTRFVASIDTVPGYDARWTGEGRELDVFRRRHWERHVNSKMHKKAEQLLDREKSGGIDAASRKTHHFFQVVYPMTLMNLAYRKTTQLYSALFLCDYPIGNKLHGKDATPDARDCMYDVNFEKLKIFMSSPNPCTNRPRDFFTTADKGTEVNQRQVINIHTYDTDGRLKKIHYMCHLINGIPIIIDENDAAAQESTSLALLEHHKTNLEKLGMSRPYIDDHWVGLCTDKEACYLKMMKLQKDINSSFHDNKDVAHGLESMWEDLEKALPWVEKNLVFVNSIYNRYSGSPKRKRKLRRTAQAFDVLYRALKRIVETRYVKFMTLAIDSLIEMFAIICAVLEDDSSSNKDSEALGLLQKARSSTQMAYICCIGDVADHLVQFSCSSQGLRFSIFDYLQHRAKFFERMEEMSKDSLTENSRIPQSTSYYCSRLHKHAGSFAQKSFKDVSLGKLDQQMRVRSSRRDGAQNIVEEALKNVRRICKEILKLDHRLESTEYFKSVDAALNPNKFDFSSYSSDYFLPHLRVICDNLGLTFTDEMLRREHKYFFNLLSLETNQEKYAAYWKVEIRKQTFWDGLGVIESFQFEPFGLHKGHEDWAYLLSRVGLEKLSQADTERVVKLQRKIEPRFSSFDETKLEAGKRDRCMLEMFSCDSKLQWISSRNV